VESVSLSAPYRYLSGDVFIYATLVFCTQGSHVLRSLGSGMDKLSRNGSDLAWPMQEMGGNQQNGHKLK
jgi:hypothetical protein